MKSDLDIGKSITDLYQCSKFYSSYIVEFMEYGQSPSPLGLLDII